MNNYGTYIIIIIWLTSIRIFLTPSFNVVATGAYGSKIFVQLGFSDSQRACVGYFIVSKDDVPRTSLQAEHFQFLS